MRTLLVGVGCLFLVWVSACGSDSGANPSDPTSDGGGPGSGGGGPGAGGGGGGSLTDGGSATAEGGDTDGEKPAGPSAGYLHTRGATIVDSSGKVVRLTGLSWFGLETSNFAPHGLWARSMGSMLDQIASLGFNMIRVPFSNQMLDAGSVPNGVDAAKNPDLVGKSALEILDALVAGAKARGLRVVLDRHRPDANAQSELWYTGSVGEQRWIDDWKKLATRYKNEPTVIGADLHNEPHGPATWGDGNAATDWRLAAERAGTAIQAIQPDWLIIVEGIEQISGSYYWWGGNLKNTGSAPVRLPVKDRVVYSPHDYPASVHAQSWFSDPSYPANLARVWDDNWGYLVKNGIAPVWIGEFGTKNQTASDQQWLRALVGYTQTNGVSFSFWCFNPNSVDTGGILQDDWNTVNADKMTVISPALGGKL